MVELSQVGASVGYGKYWNFERVIAKAQAWTSQKGYEATQFCIWATQIFDDMTFQKANIIRNLQNHNPFWLT